MSVVTFGGIITVEFDRDLGGTKRMRRPAS